VKVVSIHQPNYAPWLGFFHKMALEDIFVLLDDVQFSKQSYTNRVQVLQNGAPRWLTQPVKVSLGQSISTVQIANPAWAQAHLDTLRGAYKAAPAFNGVWPDLTAIYASLPATGLAAANRAFIEAVAARVGLQARIVQSSDIGIREQSGDDRLVAIVEALAPHGTYLSGRGGANYQDERKFAAAGVGLEYAKFEHPVYAQAAAEFYPGLSILDVLFNVGWDGAASLIGH